MSLQLLKKEVLEEMKAVQNFIELSIQAQKLGFTKAAEFFISQAQEDCHHALNYAIALDKFDAIEGNQSVSDLVKTYQDMEDNAGKRILDIISDIHKEPKYATLMPFLLEMLKGHSDEAYEAKKMLQKIKPLDEQEAVIDIEEVFEQAMDEDKD